MNAFLITTYQCSRRKLQSITWMPWGYSRMWWCRGEVDRGRHRVLETGRECRVLKLIIWLDAIYGVIYTKKCTCCLIRLFLNYNRLDTKILSSWHLIRHMVDRKGLRKTSFTDVITNLHYFLFYIFLLKDTTVIITSLNFPQFSRSNLEENVWGMIHKFQG